MKVEKDGHLQDCKNYLKSENMELKIKVADVEKKWTEKLEKLNMENCTLNAEVNSLRSRLQTMEELARFQQNALVKLRIKTGKTERQKGHQELSSIKAQLNEAKVELLKARHTEIIKEILC